MSAGQSGADGLVLVANDAHRTGDTVVLTIAAQILDGRCLDSAGTA